MYCRLRVNNHREERNLSKYLIFTLTLRSSDSHLSSINLATAGYRYRKKLMRKRDFNIFNYGATFNIYDMLRKILMLDTCIDECIAR